MPSIFQVGDALKKQEHASPFMTSKKVTMCNASTQTLSNASTQTGPVPEEVLREDNNQVSVRLMNFYSEKLSYVKCSFTYLLLLFVYAGVLLYIKSLGIMGHTGRSPFPMGRTLRALV